MRSGDCATKSSDCAFYFRKRGRRSDPQDTSTSDEMPLDAPTEGKVACQLEGQINALFEELDVRPLTDAQRRRLHSMEAKWLSRWQKDVPEHFADYAVSEALKSGTDRFAGYVLGVLERSIEEGYTVQGAPDSAAGQDFLRRTGNDLPAKEVRRSEEQVLERSKTSQEIELLKQHGIPVMEEDPDFVILRMAREVADWFADYGSGRDREELYAEGVAIFETCWNYPASRHPQSERCGGLADTARRGMGSIVPRRL